MSLLAGAAAAWPRVARAQQRERLARVSPRGLSGLSTARDGGSDGAHRRPGDSGPIQNDSGFSQGLGAIRAPF